LEPPWAALLVTRLGEHLGPPWAELWVTRSAERLEPPWAELLVTRLVLLWGTMWVWRWEPQ